LGYGRNFLLVAFLCQGIHLAFGDQDDVCFLTN
jgi:hypothetical protein